MGRLSAAKYEMLNKVMEAFEDLGDDEELGPSDWPTVKKYITCLNDIEGEREHPHIASENENSIHHMIQTDTRMCLLNGVQAAYWEMLDEGRITQATGILLMQSVDEAMDSVSHEPICDWKGLKAHVHFPRYYRFLQMGHIPERLVTYFTVDRLESACYVCAAFLRAHRIARRQLREFIGEIEIASTVINESSAEGEEAKKFLEEVRISFPQTDLKRLLRNPPLVKIPKAMDLLDTHPLLGVLPNKVRVPLKSSTKEIMKMRGMSLYKEGSKANGMWLISNGIVKWRSKTLDNRQSLHPAFSHGSTLGLYEVLVGKPFICDMVTDSAVRCFFIEADKILHLLKLDPDIEEFLWQESSTVIAKLFLPPVFEKLSLQEVRGLVAEKSRMSTHISGEQVEVPQNHIGILLEGFLKAQDSHNSLIASPAVLLAESVDLSFLGLDSSGAAVSFCY